MIIIGQGGLARRAIDHAVTRGVIVDTVFTADRELAIYCKKAGIVCQMTMDVNTHAASFNSADKVVMSINNPQILRPPLLSLPGYRFYNIHNGLLPYYRGNPAVCILFALLSGELQYGVSLHRIDSGIDTGEVYASRSFVLKETDTFQSVMLRGIQLCHEIFCDNIFKIMENSLVAEPGGKSTKRLFSYKDLATIDIAAVPPSRVKRAFELGVFSIWFNELRKKKMELGIS